MVYYYNHTANVMTSNIPPNVTTRSQDQAQQQGQQSQRSQGQQQSGFHNPYRQGQSTAIRSTGPNEPDVSGKYELQHDQLSHPDTDQPDVAGKYHLVHDQLSHPDE
ncbi:uncharacterized protein BDW47DRAFT_113988 [Aspergillus candidus]|uniref:Uncharacterized protein n=1 Tax=Aspergillus candidus TaxID=41067 RepID=A0A2I2EYI1_ASPCN|nr:hypothetical protein BDW47DRAFT_113988 [Aspergillus candidus]PLB33446.1 hypothetical protein BDW47DRAFT_113988 [Aspergillus candidus]